MRDLTAWHEGNARRRAAKARMYVAPISNAGRVLLVTCAVYGALGLLGAWLVGVM